jgi:hypothetical protein
MWGYELKERYHLVDPSIDGRIILRWIFRKCDVGLWTEGKIPLGCPKHRWEDNIKMDLQ